MEIFHKIVTLLLPISSVVLLITSLLLPPLGIIDNSVLAAAGILFAFASLFRAENIIKSLQDKSLTVKHNQTEVTIKDENTNNNI